MRARPFGHAQIVALTTAFPTQQTPKLYCGGEEASKGRRVLLSPPEGFWTFQEIEGAVPLDRISVKQRTAALGRRYIKDPSCIEKWRDPGSSWSFRVQLDWAA